MALSFTWKAEVALIENMADQFDNSELSDVTLEVGGTKFLAHKYVLAIQSPVFKTMLTGNRWRESRNSEVRLEEDDELCELHFKDFLKFFYTGKIDINYDNISSLLKLVDKYNVASLKNGCSAFIMKQIGTGEELGPIMKCIPYVNEYFPHHLPLCYKGISGTFADIEHFEISCLTLANLTMVIRGQNGSITAPDEFFVYKMVQRWILDTFDETMVSERDSAAAHLLQLIRFYNMDGTQIAEVKDSPLGKLYADTIMKHQLIRAYEVQAEMFAYSVKSPKKRKLSDGRVEHKCSCNPSSGRCEHMNPRVYFTRPYGRRVKINLTSFGHHISTHVVDLSSIDTFVKIFGKHGVDKLHRWKFICTKQGDGTFNCDHFVLEPPECHVGRSFDVGIHMNVCSRDEENKLIHYRYTLYKHAVLLSTTQILMVSPRRKKCAANVIESGKIDIAIYLS
ncbi:BTB/POZ domain-containing protein 17-like [Amphiura filiformis]|uniref:BTB/POZ domain-containing protein 17-like n=1 Tax=Amphiura filiformis TaxID=82378 RepID=UPI003B20BCF1